MAPKRKTEDATLDLTGDEPSIKKIIQDTPPADIFIPPSVCQKKIVHAGSYTHHSPVPAAIAREMSQECVLGVDEAGRGPVLGPMVYGVCYLPLHQHYSLLAEKCHFDDSKVLKPEVRSSLMKELCTPSTDLYQNCGWATRIMSARDISAGMLRKNAYNLNSQAMDATVALIQEVMDLGVAIAEIYVDTIGSPTTYQKKLERIFPAAKITVAKKADSLYPCVSAASVAAKVTRDAALEVCWQAIHCAPSTGISEKGYAKQGWGSGYPADARCKSWLESSIHNLFGWGPEGRLSWSTLKDELDKKNGQCVSVEWEQPDDEENRRISQYFQSPGLYGNLGPIAADDLLVDMWKDLSTWYGTPVNSIEA